MEYILYYNDKQKGYGFYEASIRLPQNDLDELQRICSDVAEPVTEAVALRYAPFHDDRYLLSVIFRQPNGVGSLLRGTNTVVHFLITGGESENFFTDITQKDLHDVVRRAAGLLEKTDARLNVPECPLTEQTKNRIPEAYLLTAASYAGVPTLGKQAYFGVQTPSWQEVVAMLKKLPLRLRKRISFHTGIQSVQESKGIAVNFCTSEVLEKAWRSGMTGGMSNTDKFLYVIDSSGNCECLKEDKPGLIKSRKILGILNVLPCQELVYPQLVEDASSWEELDRLLELEPRERSMDAIVRMIPANVLLQQIQSNSLKESTMVWLCQSKKLPEEIFSAIVRNEKMSAESLSLLGSTGCLSEDRILKVIDSGKLEEKDLYAMVGFVESNGMKQAAKALHKALRAMQASAIWQEDNPEDLFRQPPKKRRERPVPQPRNTGAAATVLKVLVKLAALGAMLWGCITLVKSLMSVRVLANARGYIHLVIDANVAGLLWKTLALILLSAAVSAFVTYHIMKWKTQRPHKNNEKTSQ